MDTVTLTAVSKRVVSLPATRIAAIGAVLGVLAGQAGVAGAQVTESDPTADHVSTFGGAVAWSRKFRPGEFRLVMRVGGIVLDASVASFIHPVQPDLGPAPRGSGVLAVYPRCNAAGGCDLYSLRLPAGRERRLTRRGGRAEFAAATWRAHTVYSRVARVEHSVDGTGQARSTPIFFRGEGLFSSSRRGRITRRVSAHTDLRGRSVVFSAVPSLDPRFNAAGVILGARLPRRSRPRYCRLSPDDYAGSSGYASSSYPAVTASGVFYIRQTDTRASGEVFHQAIVKQGLPGRRCPAAAGREARRTLVTPRPVTSFSTDGKRFFYTAGNGVREATGDPVSFSR